MILTVLVLAGVLSPQPQTPQPKRRKSGSQLRPEAGHDS